MSRNKDRLGMGDTRPDAAETPPQALHHETPGFSFVVPTEFVELPSGGRFYPPTHPLHGQDSIEVKQMTAKEEDLLTSRTLLKKGVALERVLQNLIVNQQIQAQSLLVGDRNAITIAIRSSAYGNMYETQITCPACGTSQEYSFDLNEMNIYEGEDRDAFGVTDNQDGTFSVQLPKTEVEVTFRLLVGRDEQAMLTQNTRKMNKATSTLVTSQLSSIVVAVNGDTSPQAIRYLVENIPSMDSRHLRAAYKLAAPNVDMTQHFACGECEHEADLEVPLTADFFWPDQ